MAKLHSLLPLVGQAPVADFLPPHIKDLHDGRKNRHNLAISTLLVTAVCAGALWASSAALAVATESLAAERSSTEKIQVAQSGYSDIISLVRESRTLGLAYFIASEPEVDWPRIMSLVLKPLSGGARITSLDLTGALGSSAGSSDPLSGEAITVTVDVDLTGTTYEAIEYFLLDARQWPGYTNSEVKDMHRTATGYVATLDVHLGLEALIEDDKRRQLLEERLAE